MTDPIHKPLIPPPSEIELEIIRQVRSLRFGGVEVQVHESHVVQIERRERFRFDERQRPR